MTNVVEWMAAANLYRFAELFKERQVTGSMLLEMNQDMLQVSTYETCLGTPSYFLLPWSFSSIQAA